MSDTRTTGGDPSPENARRRFRTIAIGAVRFVVAGALLAYLIASAWQSDQFAVLTRGSIRWERFALGCLLTLGAMLLTFERWHRLAQQLGLPLRRREAFRLGFVGFVLNFVTVGTVGGDALRAVFVAARSPGKRTAAVASVLYDRIVGLVALFLVAASALWSLDLRAIAGDDPLRRTALLACRDLATALGSVGAIGLVLLSVWSGAPQLRLWNPLIRLPIVGPRIGMLLRAAFAYSGRPAALGLALGISVPVHLINALAVVAVASSLPIERPSVLVHLGTVPIAHLAGVLPLPGGIGAFEGVLGWLYEAAAETPEAGEHGLLVAFGVRLTTLFVAAIGIVIQLVERRRGAGVAREIGATAPAASNASEPPV